MILGGFNRQAAKSAKQIQIRQAVIQGNSHSCFPAFLIKSWRPPQCYPPTSSRPVKIFPERGQLCPRVPADTKATGGQGCPRSFGCGFAALRLGGLLSRSSRHLASAFAGRVAVLCVP
jgi:hypothetical protein